MSIEDRDWIREPESKPWSFRGLPPILTIISVTTVAFIVQMAVSNGSPAGDRFIAEHMALSTKAVLDGEAWQAFTYLLLHNELSHIFWNMVGFWCFGSILQEITSRRSVWLHYVLGGLAGAVACVLWDVLVPSGFSLPIVGASGAVMAVLVAAACREPRYPLRLMLLPMPIPLWLVASIYAALDIIGAITMFAKPGTGTVAVQAHLGGAVFAAVVFLVARSRSWEVRSTPRRARWEVVGDHEALEEAAPPPRPSGADEPGVKARVDTLLAKIHAWGMDSLSDEEKAFLKNASERYRGKKR